MSDLSVTLALLPVSMRRQSKSLQELARRGQSSDTSHPRCQAAVYLGLGEKGKAFDWIEKAYEDRDPILWWINGDQLYDSVRNEPRFQAVMQKVERSKGESKQ